MEVRIGTEFGIGPSTIEFLNARRTATRLFDAMQITVHGRSTDSQGLGNLGNG